MRAGRAAVLLAAMAAFACPAHAAAADEARIVAQRSIGPNTVELTIETPAFSAPTRVQIFLPAGYAAKPKRRWPVTYYVHGAQGNEARFGDWFGGLIDDYPSIVVSPDGGQGGFYSDWYNGGAGGPPMYETYGIDQLIPLIDANFRTLGTRAGRAVIGESMGGYGTMTYAARHPDLFAAAVSMSGFLDTNTNIGLALVTGAPLLQGGQPNAIYGPRATEEVRWRGHNPTDLAANLRDVDLQVRTAEGAPTAPIEGTEPTSAVGCAEEAAIFEATTNFHERLQTLGIPHHWENYGAGCHSIPMFQREFADSLPGLEDAFSHPSPRPRTFTYESIEPRFEIWDWRIDADPARALEFLRMENAGRSGLTLVGSGTTSVTTPPWFRGRRTVQVVADGERRAVTPDRLGRITFTVDLGPAHEDQQYTPAARLAGDGSPGYFTTRTVRFRG